MKDLIIDIQIETIEDGSQEGSNNSRLPLDIDSYTMTASLEDVTYEVKPAMDTGPVESNFISTISINSNTHEIILNGEIVKYDFENEEEYNIDAHASLALKTIGLIWEARRIQLEKEYSGFNEEIIAERAFQLEKDFHNTCNVVTIAKNIFTDKQSLKQRIEKEYNIPIEQVSVFFAHASEPFHGSSSDMISIMKQLEQLKDCSEILKELFGTDDILDIGYFLLTHLPPFQVAEEFIVADGKKILNQITFITPLHFKLVKQILTNPLASNVVELGPDLQMKSDKYLRTSVDFLHKNGFKRIGLGGLIPGLSFHGGKFGEITGKDIRYSNGHAGTVGYIKQIVNEVYEKINNSKPKIGISGIGSIGLSTLKILINDGKFNNILLHDISPKVGKRAKSVAEKNEKIKIVDEFREDNTKDLIQIKLAGRDTEGQSKEGINQFCQLMLESDMVVMAVTSISEEMDNLINTEYTKVLEAEQNGTIYKSPYFYGKTILDDTYPGFLNITKLEKLGTNYIGVLMGIESIGLSNSTNGSKSEAKIQRVFPKYYRHSDLIEPDGTAKINTFGLTVVTDENGNSIHTVYGCEGQLSAENLALNAGIDLPLPVGNEPVNPEDVERIINVQQKLGIKPIVIFQNARNRAVAIGDKTQLNLALLEM